MPNMFGNIMFYLSCIMIATILSNGFCETDLKALEDKLVEYTILPDIILKMPQCLVEVKFPSGAEVKLGNTIRIEDLQETPEVHWEHNSSAYYSLCITDMDDVANSDPLLREYQLWYVHNIPGDDVSKGYEHFKYIPPKLTSPKYPHRIAVTVFEQEGYTALNKTKLLNPPRHFFAILEVMYDHKGIIYGANCFNATM